MGYPGPGKIQNQNLGGCVHLADLGRSDAALLRRWRSDQRLLGCFDQGQGLGLQG